MFQHSSHLLKKLEAITCWVKDHEAIPIAIVLNKTWHSLPLIYISRIKRNTNEVLLIWRNYKCIRLIVSDLSHPASKDGVTDDIDSCLASYGDSLYGMKIGIPVYPFLPTSIVLQVLK